MSPRLILFAFGQIIWVTVLGSLDELWVSVAMTAAVFPFLYWYLRDPMKRYLPVELIDNGHVAYINKKTDLEHKGLTGKEKAKQGLWQKLISVFTEKRKWEITTFRNYGKTGMVCP